jgi:hypothetical protein
VHQPQPDSAPQVGARKRPKHVPNHLRVGQLPVKARVVVFGAPSHVKPIRFWRNEIEHSIAGDEVGENSQRHRLVIHLAMVSACSLRAPRVVK